MVLLWFPCVSVVVVGRASSRSFSLVIWKSLKVQVGKSRLHVGGHVQYSWAKLFNNLVICIKWCLLLTNKNWHCDCESSPRCYGSFTCHCSGRVSCAILQLLVSYNDIIFLVRRRLMCVWLYIALRKLSVKYSFHFSGDIFFTSFTFVGSQGVIVLMGRCTVCTENWAEVEWDGLDG